MIIELAACKAEILDAEEVFKRKVEEHDNHENHDNQDNHQISETVIFLAYVFF